MLTMLTMLYYGAACSRWPCSSRFAIRLADPSARMRSGILKSDTPSIIVRIVRIVSMVSMVSMVSTVSIVSVVSKVSTVSTRIDV